MVSRILAGFGCRILAVEPFPNEVCRSLGVDYVEFDELLAQSDIITSDRLLTSEDEHMIDASALRKMRHGVMLINTEPRRINRYYGRR